MDTISLPATTDALRAHLRHAHALTDTTLAGADSDRLAEMHAFEHDHADAFELGHTHPEGSGESALQDSRAALDAARAAHLAALGRTLAGELAAQVATATGIRPARLHVEVSDRGNDLAIRELVDGHGTVHTRETLPGLADLNEFDAPTSHEFCDVATDGPHTLTPPAITDPQAHAEDALATHAGWIVAAAGAALADADVADVDWDGVQVMFEDVDGLAVAYPNVSAAIDDTDVRDVVDTALEREMNADRRLRATLDQLAAELGEALYAVTVHLHRSADGQPGTGPDRATVLLAGALQVPVDAVAGAVFAAVRDTGQPVHVSVELTDGTHAYLYPDHPRAGALFEHLAATVDWDAPDDGYDDRGEWLLSPAGSVASTASQSATATPADPDGRLLADPSTLLAAQRRRLARQIAELLGISRRAAYTLLDHGLPVRQLGGHRDHVAALIDELDR